MKKNSKNSLREWIKEIRIKEYRLLSLKETLEEYHVMMIGYNSPSFEPKYSSNQPTYQSNLDYWLEKIWVIEEKIERIELEIKMFNLFVSKLDGAEKLIVEGIIKQTPIKQLTKELNLDRQTYYYYIRKLNIKVTGLHCKKSITMI